MFLLAGPFFENQKPNGDSVTIGLHPPLLSPFSPATYLCHYTSAAAEAN